MGNKQSAENNDSQGYRIIKIHRSDLQQKLNVMVDYILCHDPLNLNFEGETIQVQIYSSLTESIRKQSLPIQNKKLGLDLKLECLPDVRVPQLKITKILRNSPLLKYNIQQGEYIVGVLGGRYQSLKQFSREISNIIQSISKELGLAIWNPSLTKSRLVMVKIEDIHIWMNRKMTKGLLGCELAEGWMHNCLSVSKNIGNDPKQENYQQIRNHRATVQEQENRNNSRVPVQIQKQYEIAVEKVTQETLQTSKTPQHKSNEIPKQQNNIFLKQQAPNPPQQVNASSSPIQSKQEQVKLAKQPEQIKQSQEIQVTKSQSKEHQLHNELSQKIKQSYFCHCQPKSAQCQMCFDKGATGYKFYNRKLQQVIDFDMELFLPS